MLKKIEDFRRKHAAQLGIDFVPLRAPTSKSERKAAAAAMVPAAAAEPVQVDNATFFSIGGYAIGAAAMTEESAAEPKEI